MNLSAMTVGAHETGIALEAAIVAALVNHGYGPIDVGGMEAA